MAGEDAVGLYLASRYAEAGPALRELAEAGQGGLQVLLYLSDCCLRLGLPEEAADWGDQATQQAPHSPQAWTRCGHALAEQGEWSTAAECYGRAWELDRKAPDHSLHLGLALLHLGQRERAREVLEQARQAHPSQPSLHEAWGRLLVSERRWEEALRAYREAHLQAPLWARPLLGMAGCLQELGRFEEAATCAHEALRRDPDPAEGWGRLASVLLSSLQAGPLIREVLGEALRRQPDNPSWWSWLGASQASDGNYREAVGCYQQAAILEPGVARHRYNWGIASGQLGRWSDAVLHLRRALELEDRPEYRQALKQAQEHLEGDRRVA